MRPNPNGHCGEKAMGAYVLPTNPGSGRYIWCCHSARGGSSRSHRPHLCAARSSPHIGEAHLEAAIEIWRYAEASARHISGDAIGDPVADTILAALREAGPDGMTRTEISGLFDRNISSAKLIAALQTLVTLGVARPISRQTAGRPAEVWIAI